MADHVGLSIEDVQEKTERRLLSKMSENREMPAFAVNDVTVSWNPKDIIDIAKDASKTADEAVRVAKQAKESAEHAAKSAEAAAQSAHDALPFAKSAAASIDWLRHWLRWLCGVKKWTLDSFGWVVCYVFLVPCVAAYAVCVLVLNGTAFARLGRRAWAEAREEGYGEQMDVSDEEDAHAHYRIRTVSREADVELDEVQVQH